MTLSGVVRNGLLYTRNLVKPSMIVFGGLLIQVRKLLSEHLSLQILVFCCIRSFVILRRQMLLGQMLLLHL
jgi:hypothetical protein